MAVESLKVKAQAITGDSDNRKIEHVLLGNDVTDIEVLDYAQGALPLFHDGMPRGPIQLSLERDRDPEVYYISAQYTRSKGTTREERPGDPSNTAEFNFDLSLATQRFKKALDQVGYSKDGGAFTENRFVGKGKPINVQETREGGLTVEGVDLQVPTATFGLDFSFSKGTLNSLFVKQLQDLIGKVNNKTFMGRQPGEVMLIGASGRQRLFGDSDISLRFEVRKNETIDQIGDGTFPISNDGKGIPKKGFEFLWVLNGFKKGPNSTNAFVAFPTAVYVAKVYEESDLNNAFPPKLVVGTAGDFVTGHKGIAVQGVP
jgi:hypothetical protein